MPARSGSLIIIWFSRRALRQKSIWKDKDVSKKRECRVGLSIGKVLIEIKALWANEYVSG
jgi:hypothetical protein